MANTTSKGGKTAKKTSSSQTAKKSTGTRSASQQKAPAKRSGAASAASAPKKERDFSGIYNAAPYIIAVVAILITVCIIFGEGNVGGSVRRFLTGLFAGAAYVLPVFLIVRALLLKKDRNEGHSAGRTVCWIIIFIMLSCLLHIWGKGSKLYDVGILYNDGINLIGGGVVGGFIGQTFVNAIGDIASWIILLLVTIILVFYVLSLSPKSIYINIAYRIKFAGEKRAKKKAERLEKEINDPPASKVREEEYLRYLRRLREEKKERKKNEYRQLTIEDIDDDDTVEPQVDEEKQPEKHKPTIYRYRRQRASELFSEADSDLDSTAEPRDPKVDNISDGEYDEDIDVPETDKDPVDSADQHSDQYDGTEDSGSLTEDTVNEKIFDEVMKRTRERIENSKFVNPDEIASDIGEPDGEPEYISDSDDDDETGSVSAAVLNPNLTQPKIGDMSDIIVDSSVQDQINRISKGGVSTPTSTKSSLPSVQKSVSRQKPKYKFPPISLLTEENSKNNPDSMKIEEELKNNGRKLVETLKTFKVNTKIENISRGPTVTRYELLPETGVRVNAITKLSADIAMNLAAVSVRIEAPIPGKSAVGVEIPNKTRTIVRLRTLLEDKRFVDAESKLYVALGQDVAGENIYMNITKMPHVLIAGATNSGKSICINSIITSILYKSSPEDVKMILIDPKMVEFLPYDGIPHLLVPVVSSAKKAAGALSWAVSEMERRYTVLKDARTRNIVEYNEKASLNPEKEHLPYIVIVIDELADLMMAARNVVEDSIVRIAQKARAAGIHLIIGTQRPSVDVVTGIIKANVPSRIAFRTASQTDSRTILDNGSAFSLIGMGDMLYHPVTEMKPIRIQGAFVDTDETNAIVEYLKENNAMYEGYSDEVSNQIEREAQKYSNEEKGAGKAAADEQVDASDEDPMLKDAVELAIEQGKISTSLIQRKLSLGYGRAAKLIDRMEELGYVSAPEGQKPREVLISKQQYMEMRLKSETPFDE